MAAICTCSQGRHCKGRGHWTSTLGWERESLDGKHGDTAGGRTAGVYRQSGQGGKLRGEVRSRTEVNIWDGRGQSTVNRTTRQVEKGEGPSPGQRQWSAKAEQNSWGEVDGSTSLKTSWSCEKLLKYLWARPGLISGGQRNQGGTFSWCRRVGLGSEPGLADTHQHFKPQSFVENAVSCTHPNSLTGNYFNLTSDNLAWDSDFKISKDFFLMGSN